MKTSPDIIGASIIATYQDNKKNTCYIIKPTLENDPARYEIVIYRDGDNIIPILFSKEDCLEPDYWSREDGMPEPFIRDMAEQVAVILKI